jgi:hypothetical protein
MVGEEGEAGPQRGVRRDHHDCVAFWMARRCMYVAKGSEAAEDRKGTESMPLSRLRKRRGRVCC